MNTCYYGTQCILSSKLEKQKEVATNSYCKISGNKDLVFKKTHEVCSVGMPFNFSASECSIAGVERFGGVVGRSGIFGL